MTDQDDLDSARWFATLAKDLAGQPDQRSTARRVTELAARATGCAGAAIAHLSAGRLSFEYASEPALIAHVSEIGTATRQGAVWHALTSRATVVIEDMSTETRWPDYSARMLAETSVRSCLVYCLALGDSVFGAMALYATQPGFFTPALCRFADVYADHAAIALARIAEHDRADNLESALASNRMIGAAIGIVMTSLELDMEAAFGLLRITSQHGNRKLHDVAELVVAAGDISVIGEIAQSGRRHSLYAVPPLDPETQSRP